MLFEQVETRCPELPVGRQPRVEVLKRRRPQPIDAPLRVRADFDEPRVAEDAQVLGDRRLADGQVVDKLANRQIRASEQIQNAAPVGLGEDFERRVHLVSTNISNGIYSCQGMDLADTNGASVDSRVDGSLMY